jgi:hypothetical protein
VTTVATETALPATSTTNNVATGELVLSSDDLQAIVGNYGRADLEFSIEQVPENIIAQRIVVSNGGLTELTLRELTPPSFFE